YGIQCVESATGKPIWRTHVSMGGSEFARAPAVPIAIDGGTAYLQTNAGTLAAVDAFTGELRWVRKYEIDHPFRPPPKMGLRARQNRVVGNPNYYYETELNGFGPSDMIVRDGRIVFAPVGGNVIHCLDAASGEPIWMQSRTTPMRYLMGANKKCIYIG